MLKATVAGEVRADRLSRALYSTDASVYQIVPAGGRAARVPRPTSWRRSGPAGSFGVPLTARGGGTSQAGQSIGPGVILDCSKHFNRVLEINPAERWARVEPGCVLDDLNRALQAARPPVRPGYLDLQPGDDRRHGRQQLVGDALGLLRQDDRPCARAEGRPGRRQRRRDSARSTHAELEARCRQEDLEGACYRVTRRLAAEHADEIDAAVPEDPPPRRRLQPRRLCPRPAGDRRRRPVQPGPPVRRLGGDARRDGRGQAPAGRAAPRQGDARRRVRRPARRPGVRPRPSSRTARRPSRWSTTTCSTARSSTPRPSRLRDFLQGDPGAILIIELYGDDAGELAPAARRARSRPASAGRRRPPARGAPTPRHRRGSGSCGRWRWASRWPRRGRQGDLVRRGHGRRPRAPARLHRRVPRRSSPGTAPRPGSTPTPRSAACTSGR